MKKDIHYWIGTLNRLKITEGEEKPAFNWEDNKKEWREVSEEEYTKTYENVWENMANDFLHC